MKALHAVPITAENFAPFGWLVARPDRPADLVAAGDLKYWDRIVPYGEALVAPNLGVLHLRRHELTVSSLELIPDHKESYFDLEKQPAVLVVAPNRRGKPDMKRAAAFDLRGHSVVVNAGVWHDHPYPYRRSSKYALLTSGGTIVRDTDGNVVVNGTQVFRHQLRRPIRIVVDSEASNA